MKALSIRQPWAWAIIHAGKDIENRSWGALMRGPILIHAAKGMTRGEYSAARAFMLSLGVRPPQFEDLPRGGIIGRALMVDCVTHSSSPWFFGPHGFVLEDQRLLPFQPCRGSLGFFTPDLAGTASVTT